MKILTGWERVGIFFKKSKFEEFNFATGELLVESSFPVKN